MTDSRAISANEVGLDPKLGSLTEAHSSLVLLSLWGGSLSHEFHHLPVYLSGFLGVWLYHQTLPPLGAGGESITAKFSSAEQLVSYALTDIQASACPW